jgi:Ca-activated chloride channel family protein
MGGSYTGRTVRGAIAAMVAGALVAAGCASGDDEQGRSARGECLPVPVAVSSEKIDLLTTLADSFNSSDESRLDSGCVQVDVRSKPSGGAMTALSEGWDEAAEGPRPVIWSPASSSWGTILNQRLKAEGEPAMAPADPTPFMLTPLVIAMPQPMAEALGWPDEPIGWAQILELSRSEGGWADLGHPEWGEFRLGKTNPNYSTSGLSALIAQTYAATGKDAGLSREDLADPAVMDYGRSIESSVVHYGDITMTFLNNWYRADRRDNALTYASAVAVEEKSVIDYNRGDPDGVRTQGEEPRPPRTPLVAIYPSEGTLYSDNPFYILDAEWVTPAQRAGAEAFQEYVQQPANQERVLEFGFRPGNPEVALAEPISTDYGVDPDQPSTLLEVPSGEVMDELLGAWATQRKGARVLMVLDVSGSMGDPADPDDPNGPTRLDLAKEAVIEGLDDFKGEDLVGLRVFTTDDQGVPVVEDLSPVAPIAANREALAREVDGLFPRRGTPLYQVTSESFTEMLEGYDPALINAVIVLTDGQNDDDDPSDDREQFEQLLSEVRRNSEGENSRPIRIFTVAYGAEADPAELRQIAEASNATAYRASDATTIDQVFEAVVSNF